MHYNEYTIIQRHKIHKQINMQESIGPISHLFFKYNGKTGVL